MNKVHPRNFVDYITRTRKISLRINVILTFRDENRVNLFRFFLYNHSTKGSRELFKDLNMRIAYKIQRILRMY